MRWRQSFGALSTVIGGILLAICQTTSAAENAPVPHDVLFDNFNFGDTYQAGFAYTLSLGPPVGVDFDQGDAFTVPRGSDPAGTTYQLEQIELAVGLIAGPNSLEVQLTEDADGEPGAVLETFSIVGQMGHFGSVNRPIFATSNGVTLKGGEQYWLIASTSDPGTSAVWHFNTIRDLGPHAQRQNLGEWTVAPGNPRGVFRISASQSSAPPPPSCPFSSALQDLLPMGLPPLFLTDNREGALNIVRQFRDRLLSQTPEGQQLARLYYEHADETIQIMRNNPRLTLRTLRLIAEALPSIRKSVSAGEGTLKLDSSTYSAALALIDRYASLGAPEYGKALEKAKSFLATRASGGSDMLTIDFRRSTSPEKSSAVNVGG